jgi:hypothetical protein
MTTLELQNGDGDAFYVDGEVLPSGAILLRSVMCQLRRGYVVRIDGGDWLPYICQSTDDRQSVLEPINPDYPVPPEHCVEDIKAVTIDF